jgi:hypothetical protein
MRILQMLPKVIRPIKLLFMITLRNAVHRLDVRNQLVAVGRGAAVLARKLAAAEAAHVPGRALVRLRVVGQQRVLERLARPKVVLEVDGVEVALGFGGGFEALLTLRAGVRLLGFVLAGDGVRVGKLNSRRNCANLR